MKKVYFDSAATTQLRIEVVDRITNVLTNNYGNPSSIHSYGRSSKSILENSRKEIAGHLNVSAAEIIFTSGGTEADNLILNSCIRDLGVTRIVTSKIEHHAVLHTIIELKRIYKVQVEYVKLDEYGRVDIVDLERLLMDNSLKTLVSLMHVNNEIGCILDLESVGALCEKYNVLFHSDCVQSVGHFKLDFSKISVDFAAVAAHKFHGPKGAGFAFIRKSNRVQPLILGGEQEKGLRAGTEAVYAIAGMAEALNISYQNLDKEKQFVTGIKDYFKSEIKKAIPGAKFNGGCDDNSKNTYTILNICFPISSEKALLLLFQLDLNGIACSKGSACQSGSSKGSHVLNEILSAEDLQKPSIRFSFSIFNTKEEVDYVVSFLKNFIEN